MKPALQNYLLSNKPSILCIHVHVYDSMEKIATTLTDWTPAVCHWSTIFIWPNVPLLLPHIEHCCNSYPKWI